MTKSKVRKAVKARIYDVITNQSGEHSYVLKETMKKMGLFKKTKFINNITHYVSLDIKEKKIIKEKLIFAIDDYLFSSEEYIKEYFN